MARTKPRGFRNPKDNQDVPSTPEAWVSQGTETTSPAPTEIKKKRITLTVTEDLHKKAHIYARMQGVTVTELVTRFLEEVTANQ